MLTDPDSELMRIFDFTAADLVANRSGKLSTNQIQRLLNIAQTQKDDRGCLELLMLPFYIVLGCIVIQQFLSANTTERVIFVILIAVLILAAVANIRDTYYRKHPAEEDASLGKIEQAEGQLQLIVKKRRYGASNRMIDDDYLQVNGVDFPIKKVVQKTLEQFLTSKSEVPTCRIYYAPKSLQIIAAEVIHI